MKRVVDDALARTVIDIAPNPDGELEPLHFFYSFKRLKDLKERAKSSFHVSLGLLN
jgi:hypothetical protein